MPSTCACGFVMAEDARPADALRLDGVSVRFGSVLALDQVSLHVPRGSVLGLIGRNGAGKSTAVRVLAGLLPPHDGHVEVGGRTFADAGVQIRADTGYLLSEPALFAYLTPGETLRFLAEAYGIAAPEGARRTEDLLRFWELEDARDRLVEGFSTGMAKRLALAAAMIHAPSLLVLDEPFESLDPLTVRSLKRLLRRYSEVGGSALISSHLLDAVEEVCDQVAILEAGRVVFEGPTERARPLEERGQGTLEERYAAAVRVSDEMVLEWLRPGMSGP